MLLDPSAQLLTVLRQNDFFEEKTMKRWFLHHKNHFAIKRSKVELKHPNLWSVRMFEDALGCSISRFYCFMAK